MKVKCVDVSVKDFDCVPPLTLGQIYIASHSEKFSDRYILEGFSEWFFYETRFQVLSDDACPQCGEIH
jgi:hypothetical protein